MYLKQSFSNEFIELMFYLKSKYPIQLFELEGINRQLDMCFFSSQFFSTKTTADVSVDSNANVSDNSNIAYTTELPKPFLKLNSLYMLWKHARRLYGQEVANDIIEKQIKGEIYINDMHGIASGTPYCFNYSTYDIMLLGLPMVDRIKSDPPKHLYSFKSQLEQFVVIASNSTLGATGLADIFMVMSYYVKNILTTRSDAGFKFASEEDCWKYVKENIISFIYTINQPFRSGLQSAFTNVSIYDKYFMENLCNDYVFPDGTKPDLNIVCELQDLFLDIMNEELDRTPFTFPVTTACFCVDENNGRAIMDQEFLRKMIIKNLKYGFINFYYGDKSTLSSCCRLRSNTDNPFFNSFGAGSSKIGSLGVCSINLPNLAFRSVGEEDSENYFFENLQSLIGVCARVNHTKRTIVKKRIDNGNLPLYTLGFMELSKQYSTCGINGLSECLEIMGYDICDEKGQKFALKIMDLINRENEKFENRYHAPHNCEQIPGESTSVKLAKKDAVTGLNKIYEIYSNQFIPLTKEANMLDRIKLQGIFDKEFSGGSIMFINIEQRIEDPDRVVKLMNLAATKGVIYCNINYNIQECANGHRDIGREETCSICGEPITANYTRVVGFLTKTENWNQVRREIEGPARKFYQGV